ncbi:helix-turn-helix domain-containing protein [Mycobacterium paragordonae]|jgi:transcriptional regulator with XRE-family HTH domain|uniref:helix-turn-helix domain-containing protein n=1 Tax=Mycobacterium paragordonae TaxID=1389713 RepID=UPI00105D2C81|nr:helix-turn-helix transcriptional regulator [Mycobacterium paragordonae]TDL02899.1 transcriptional regulator [Mycobacterium paragordonae]
MTRRVLRGFTPRAFLETRQRRGLSQADLARLADLGLSTIKAWESGRRSPQVDLLKRAMDILETPIDEVVLIAPADRYPGDWRVIQGMTQPQLAAAAKIATSTLREIESAELALTDANASTLAHLLGIPTDTYRTSYRRARTRPAGTSA